MAVVTFNKKYLFALVGKDISDKILDKYIQNLGFSVEGLNEEEVSIDITPNRPDLLDIVGFARVLRNFMHYREKLEYKLASGEPVIDINVGDSVAKIRPFISSLVVKNLNLNEESLKYIISFTEKFSETFGRKRSKLAMGLHDLSKIKGNITYDAKLEGRFTPLNGSDEKSFSEIMQTHEKGLAYSHTIKGAYYPVLEDAEGVLSLIPIINSDRTKVTKETKEMLVDITGTSQYIVESAADLFACMFIDLGASVYRTRIIYKKEERIVPEMTTRTILIKLLKIEKQIGVEIGFNNVISLANKMGYKAIFKDSFIEFFIPPYRLDIINEQDIVEDIAIGYGYEFVHPISILSEVLGGKLDKTTVLKRKLIGLMLGLGFSEANNNYLTNEKLNFEMMNIEPVPHIQIKSSKSENITMMRTWLLPSLLGNISASAHEKMPQKMFELDFIFNIQNGEIIESNHLAGVYTSPKINFNDMKSILTALFHSLGITEFEIKNDENGSFIAGRCAKISSEALSGFFGEIHPKVLNNFGIEEPTVAFELAINTANWKTSMP
ncbi:MAG: phenylalanine--tRNA ligase subunit beta [Candidatus Micrarchaeia archaeon]